MATLNSEVLISEPIVRFATFTTRLGGNPLDVNVLNVDAVEDLGIQGTRIHFGGSFFDVQEGRATVLARMKGE